MRDCCCLLLSAGPGLALPLLAGGWATGGFGDGRAGEGGGEVPACATATLACVATVFRATVLAGAAGVCTELSCMGRRVTSAINASDCFTACAFTHVCAMQILNRRTAADRSLCC